MPSTFRRLSMSSCAAIAMMALAAPVAAQTQVQTVAFDIPAQNLAAALRTFARQSGQQVIFDGAAARGKTSHALKGHHAVEAGLELLLRGSGLQVRRGEHGVLMVGNGPQDAAASSRFEPATVDELMVTGTRLKQALDNGFPLNSYSREALEGSGQPNLGAFLTTLTEVSINTATTAPFAGTNGLATVQLRGLPIGTTLMLVNGRRVQSFGSSSGTMIFDLNSIPFEAIERVDIVPVGSSAVYGGDALAGVVNVILKRSFEGLSFGARYGVADGTQDRGLSLAMGKTFDRGSFLIMAATNKTTPLTTVERNFLVDTDYRRFGGPDARVRTCLPGTVTSATTANLPGLNSTLAAIPNVASGTPLTIANFAAGAGAPNLCGEYAGGDGYALINGSESHAFHASGEYQLFGRLTLFGEATYNRENIFTPQGALTLSNLLVPATNAFNPFGVPVRVSARLGEVNGLPGRKRETEYERLLAGVRGSLPNSWDFEASVMTSRDKSDATTLNGLIGSAARVTALASSDPALALNPFTTGRAASEAVLRSIWANTVARVADGKHEQASAFLRGTFAALPAGDVAFVVGAEASRSGWATVSPASSNPTPRDLERTASAGFAEVNLPLLAARGNSRRTIASLSLAGRTDSFSDYGKAQTYQVGLELRPVKTLNIRVATASSFKPPSLQQLYPTPQTLASQDFGLRDPSRNNEAVIGAVVPFGAGPGLDAETGKAKTFGLVWQPDAAPGLRVGVSVWSVDIDSLVTLLDPQIALNNESLFSSLIVRAPAVGGLPGPIQSVAYAYVNVGSIKVAGIDYDASYARATRFGQLQITAGATQTTKYKTQVLPGAAIEDRLGRRYLDYWAPEWKGRASIGLDHGAWRISLAGRYVGAYLDNGVSTRRLGDRWAYDLAAAVKLLDDKTQLSLTVANLGNQKPQFAGTSGAFYDQTQSDWRGRYATLRLTANW